MPLTLAQGAQIVDNVGYQRRVRVAMVRQARAVAAEAQGGMTQAEWLKRKELSRKVLQSPDSWLTPFLAAVAADASNAPNWYTPVPIASSTTANPSVITTTGVHGLVVGDVVEISGPVGNTNIAGTWQVATVPTTTTFTVPMPGGPAAGTAGGFVMKQESDVAINTTVTNLWSGMAGTYTGEV